jgi:hypothetical protein
VSASVHDYIALAQQVPPQSPEMNTAVGVCALRQQDPFEQVWFQGIYLARWRAVILEAALLTALGDVVRS